MVIMIAIAMYTNQGFGSSHTLQIGGRMKRDDKLRGLAWVGALYCAI